MKNYSINDLALMTGFTTRTLRNYIKSGMLKGEKENGVWRFTEKNYYEFMSVSEVSKGLASKRNAQVNDFLFNDKKTENQVCMIMDLRDRENETEVSDFFCNLINTNQVEGVKFSFSKHGKYTRIILIGEENAVSQLMKSYYGW